MASHKLCSAPHCRFSDNHVVASHRCGICGIIGHSQPQCGKKLHGNMAIIYERVPEHLQCTMYGCPTPTFHTTAGHCCTFCGRRDGTHLRKCPITVRTFDTDMWIKPEPHSMPIDGHYVRYYGGQGSDMYCRNNHGIYEYFFLHGDSKGQYGEDTNEWPLVNAFILGYSPM